MNKHNVASYFIGLLALAISAISVGVMHRIDYRVAKIESAPVMIQNGQAAGPWGLLRQNETDALSKSLAGHSGNVTIYCTLDCQGLALDLDNAFETARWKSHIERPVIDTNTGINVAGPDAEAKALADKINKATNNRFKVSTIPGHVLGVVISTRK